jgi:hypothetical protein
MSSNLYKEALFEVEELKRMAEENAKNKIIEAVTPKIRHMIEAQLLGEKKIDDLDNFDDDSLEDEDDTDNVVIGSDDFELDMSSDLIDSIPEPATSQIVDLQPLPAVEPTSAAAPRIKIDVQGDLNIDMDAEEEDLEDDLILGRQLGDVVEGYILGKRRPAIRIKELARKTAVLSKMFETTSIKNASPTQKKIALLYYAKLLDEAVSLVTSGIIIEESVGSGLLGQLKTTIKEIRHMANRKDAVAFRRLLEELEADDSLQEMMREEDEDVAVDEPDEDAEFEDVAEEDVDVPAAQDALGDLAVALGMNLDDEVPAGDEEEDVLDVEASEEPLELGEADEVLEIDESMLRREILRMKEGLEAEAGAAAAHVDEFEDVGDPLDAQEDFGGSEEVLEVSEEDLVEALRLEIGRARRGRRSVPRRRRVTETRRRRARRSTRKPVTRRTHATAGTARKINEANKKLRNQLNEMNVFNAKLLFANKLMQNRGLTRKQQRTIVEALDSAKTVNEAKLLYKSLSTSLTQGGTLTESKNRLLASSSRSTRSASPASNGVDGDRWALLAGLSGKNNQ